jgi:ABC-2 type transport system permease protein
MNPLAAIIKMRLAAFRNVFRNVRKDALAKTFVVCFGLLNVIGIGLWVSYISFRFVERLPAFGVMLNSKLIGLLFFALLLLVVLSTVIICYTTIFLARETAFFFQHPIPPRTTFAVKLGEAVAMSSWATLFLCYPVLVAFGVLRGAPALYYLEAALVLGVFLLFAGFTGATVAILAAPIVRRLTLVEVMGGGAVVLLLISWAFLRSFHLWETDGEDNLLLLDRFTTQLSVLQSPYFPGHWAAGAVLAASVGNHGEALFQGATLLANTLVFIPFLAAYGSRRYTREWLAACSEKRRKVRPAAEERSAPRRRGRARNPLAALVVKDLVVFLRDPAQVSQSILFLALMLVYSLSLLRMPAGITSQYSSVLYFANLGALCAILSSFTSRFLFPLVSLEGRAFWIVGLAPIPRSHLLYQKALFGLGMTLTLGLLTALVSSLALGHSGGPLASALYTTALAGVCLTSLAVGLGAAYPNFQEDNPARIAIGLGGTLNFFASALAVAILIGIEATPYLLAARPGLFAVGGAHLVALFFTLCLSSFCLRLGSRALARSEF